MGIDSTYFKYVFFSLKMFFFSFFIKFSSDTCHDSNIKLYVISTIAFDWLHYLKKYIYGAKKKGEIYKLIKKNTNFIKLGT